MSRRAFLAGAALAGCGRAPHVPTQGTCPTSAGPELRFLTWNVFMMPSWIGESPRNQERAAKIAEVLLQQDFDVLCLQKVFDPAARAVLEQALAGRYCYRFGPANDSCSPMLDSGVWVLSRVPLTDYREIEFEECGEIECFSRKGAILLSGTAGHVPFRLIATHLQGEEGPEYTIFNDRVRAKQMRAIRDRLVLPFAAPEAPFIICGDFGTPRFTQKFHRESPNYAAMLETLGATNGNDERITLDDTDENQLAIDKTGRRSEMDYILVRSPGRALAVERRRHVFRAGGWDDPAKNRTDLSYRYAVSAKITFEVT